ncbi:hypothetical protein NB644_05395 [Oxalobacter formigenes]|nr:hypothetical protein [Oxalobacter formigenes]WAW02459.1 hypothetical protein NB644_05395 [Oxalobacter formigenes]WAW02727.1 hypothetical protein NB642_06190 [Oxalobacter formigenes]
MEIYKVCSDLLVASEAGGFGLSIVEGTSYGKPLMFRNISVFKEIAVEYAFYFHGLKPDDLSICLKGWISLLEKKKPFYLMGLQK